jgi:hypothetical protein
MLSIIPKRVLQAYEDQKLLSKSYKGEKDKFNFWKINYGGSIVDTELLNVLKLKLRYINSQTDSGKIAWVNFDNPRWYKELLIDLKCDSIKDLRGNIIEKYTIHEICSEPEFLIYNVDLNEEKELKIPLKYSLNMTYCIELTFRNIIKLIRKKFSEFIIISNAEMKNFFENPKIKILSIIEDAIDENNKLGFIDKIIELAWVNKGKKLCRDDITQFFMKTIGILLEMSINPIIANFYSVVRAVKIRSLDKVLTNEEKIRLVDEQLEKYLELKEFKKISFMKQLLFGESNISELLPSIPKVRKENLKIPDFYCEDLSAFKGLDFSKLNKMKINEDEEEIRKEKEKERGGPVVFKNIPKWNNDGSLYNKLIHKKMAKEVNELLENDEKYDKGHLNVVIIPSGKEEFDPNRHIIKTTFDSTKNLSDNSILYQKDKMFKQKIDDDDDIEVNKNTKFSLNTNSKMKTYLVGQTLMTQRDAFHFDNRSVEECDLKDLKHTIFLIKK